MSLSSHALLAQVVNTKLQHAKKITNLLKDLCSQLRVLYLNKRFQMSHNMLVLQALLVVFKIRLAREIIKLLEDLCNLFHNKKFLTNPSILAQQVVLVVFKLQLAREIIKFLKDLRSQLQVLHLNRKF